MVTLVLFWFQYFGLLHVPLNIFTQPMVSSCTLGYIFSTEDEETCGFCLKQKYFLMIKTRKGAFPPSKQCNLMGVCILFLKSVLMTLTTLHGVHSLLLINKLKKNT